MRVLKEYRLTAEKLTHALTFLIVGDLHNEPWEDLLPFLEGADALLIPGDLGDRYRKAWDRSCAFIRTVSGCLPVFISAGNHDLAQPDFLRLAGEMEKAGAHFLCESFVPFRETVIGGTYRPSRPHSGYERLCENARFPISDFPFRNEYRILLSHKPHQAITVPGDDADLIISGHAHGGQICWKGRGVYAPGQGLMPKLTHGIYQNRLLVTSGAGNPIRLPRWGNPREAVRLVLEPVTVCKREKGTDQPAWNSGY